MIDVSIIIINYNTKQLVIDAINSVYEKTRELSYEIIVVDNDSKDGSAIELQEHFGDRITLLALPENIGFGRANNKGVEIAKGRNILFLNSDTLLINNAVKILSDELDKNRDYGGVGGNLYDIDEQPAHSYKSIFPTTVIGFHILSLGGVVRRILRDKNFQFNYTDKNRDVTYITGADLMIPAHLLESVGVFNPLFFMYFEEIELCYRVKKSGFRIMSIPSAKIIHLEGGSFANRESVDRFKRKLHGEKIYYQLTGAKIYGVIAKCASLSIFIAKYLISLIEADKQNQRSLSLKIKVLLNLERK